MKIKILNYFMPLQTWVNIIVLTLLFLCMFSCGKDIEKQVSEYEQNYDELFTFGLSINDFAQATGVSVEDLVNMRYGVMKPSKELTKIMSKLNKEFSKHRRSEALEKINKQFKDKSKVKIDKNKVEISIDKLENNYRVAVLNRNERFDSQLPSYVGNQINLEVENFIDSKFAWYKFPINAWEYVIDGKNVLYNRYKSGFDKVLSSESVNSLVVSRFNDYSTLLTVEQAILFDRKLNLPVLKDVNLESATSIADSGVLDKSVRRAATDLTDMILLLIEEIGVAIIIWMVFSWLSNLITNKYAAWVLDYDIDGGFWKNGFIFGLNLLNSYWESEERRKLARIKRWTQGIITVAFLIGSYFWVIRPQMVIENELLSRIETNIADYIGNMDVPILNYFNSVIDSTI